MKLTNAERWILRNQLRILELLDEEDAEDYAIRRKAIEHGYELAYEGAMPVVCPDNEVLTEDECKEVVHIMAMFQVLQRSAAKLKNLSEYEKSTAEFGGFDGNNEGGQLGYCRFMVEDEHRFEDLPRGDNFNSHGPLLDSYRRMLDVWISLGRPAQLDEAQTKKVLAASVHPSRRSE